MTRTIFAMAVAGLMFAAVTGTSQAAPIAPLPAGVSTTDHGTVTQVRWGWHRWHRHCWRGRFGRLHCW
jgi:hypothetical protein